MLRVLAVTVVTLVTVTPAQADTLTDKATPQVIAQHYWQDKGRTPCAPVHVRIVPDTPAGWPDGIAWAQRDICTMTLNGGYWGYYSRADQCSFIVHEYGHLTGLGHSNHDEWYDPTATAYPIMDARTDYIPRECKSARRNRTHVQRTRRVCVYRRKAPHGGRSNAHRGKGQKASHRGACVHGKNHRRAGLPQGRA